MTTQITYQSLLKEAITVPGIISDCYRQFHTYSMSNCMAAYVQCLERGIPYGAIATYRKWTELGRQVKKGEKAIVLCQPLQGKAKEQQPDGTESEHKYVFFKWSPRWFVLSQTEGESVPEVSIPDFDVKAAMVNLKIEEEAFSMGDGNVQGYATGNRIAINPICRLPHKTRFHEIAHIVLGHTKHEDFKDGETIAKDVREVEAESVAYILCSLFELDGRHESRGYIQAWLGGAEIQEKTAQRIFKAVDTILRAGRETKGETEGE